MNRKKRIEKILSKHLNTWDIEVKDISFQHQGHNNFTGNDETHFSLILKPSVNISYKRIEIHKKINDLLVQEFTSGLHALEIKIKS